MLKSSCVAPLSSMRPIENRPGANGHTRPLWAEFIFVLDSWLQWWGGVFEYSQKPDCVFRAQFSRLSSDVLLSEIGRSGDRVIDLHLWNEQIPVAPMAGYSLAWGCRFSRSFAKSLGELAQSLANKPELSDDKHRPRDYKSRLASSYRRATWIRGHSRRCQSLTLGARASVRPKYSVLAVDACVSLRPYSAAEILAKLAGDISLSQGDRLQVHCHDEGARPR